MDDALGLTEYEAAQREVAGDGPTFPWADRKWQLPAMLPWSVLDVLARPSDQGYVRAAQDLLGDQYEDFLDTSPPLRVVTYLVTHAFEAYGADLPKSSGSSEPSPDDGEASPSKGGKGSAPSSSPTGTAGTES